ncbi:hypothetical protein BH11PAT2_BH11PAT2_07030 [soil metagenome]
MKGFEFSQGPSYKKEEALPNATYDDFADTPVLQGMLRRLPPELRNVHAARMGDMAEQDAFAYIQLVLENRESAVRESVVSEPEFEAYFQAHEQEIWKDLETTVFTDINNLVGNGTTARIKEYELENAKGEKVRTAIKYLTTPTEKTLSVSGEHDLILEVERVSAIEVAERKHESKIPHLRVPHPFFYYKKGKTQCYGMELIDGINLEEGLENKYSEETGAELRTALAGLSRQALAEEVELFFDTMHEICIHGDIKPANIMVTKDGHFYIIDFGQSILINDIDDKSRDAMEVLKSDDKGNARRSMMHFLDALGV